MLSIFNSLRNITLSSVAVRLLLAVILGGVIGIEREYKRRPAGFRTHILICLGATMTTMTSQYLYLNQLYFTDMARLGAQVVAGIGFIGAGTIIVTRHQRVKGLTTAAGLWASAIIGLCIGGGFYEGGIFSAALIVLVELLFSKLEYRLLDHAPEVNLYIEYRDRACLESILALYRIHKLKIISMEVTRSTGSDTHNACAIFSIRLTKKYSALQLLKDTSTIEGMILVEEL